MNPFERGYVDAARASIGQPDAEFAPDTLAGMIRDCAAYQSVPARRWMNTEVSGAEWFKCVQRGDYTHVGFPPKTLALDPAGKVVALPSGIRTASVPDSGGADVPKSDNHNHSEGADK